MCSFMHLWQEGIDDENYIGIFKPVSIRKFPLALLAPTRLTMARWIEGTPRVGLSMLVGGAALASCVCPTFFMVLVLFAHADYQASNVGVQTRGGRTAGVYVCARARRSECANALMTVSRNQCPNGCIGV